MKILALYLIVINLILFGNCAKNKEANLFTQIILFFLPTLILALYVLTRA